MHYVFYPMLIQNTLFFSVVNTLDSTTGFQRGLEPHHIQGATFSNHKLMFVIVWKNPETAEPITDNNMLDVVFATEVYEKYPQLAISFFEDRIEFH